MPTTGTHADACKDDASRVPTNGPMQANDVKEKVNPRKSPPIIPCRRDVWSNLVSRAEGRVISKTPSKLSDSPQNMAAMSPLTHGLLESCTTPNGLEINVTTHPRIVSVPQSQRKKALPATEL